MIKFRYVGKLESRRELCEGIKEWLHVTIPGYSTSSATLSSAAKFTLESVDNLNDGFIIYSKDFVFYMYNGFGVA